MSTSIKRIDSQKAWIRAQKFCAYQERCQQEVRDKLYGWGLHKSAVEEILTRLIIEGFVNEERFAKAYASGKLRIKKWGKKKIRMALMQKCISEYCIKQALGSLKENEYLQALRDVLNKKEKTLNESNPLLKKQKLGRYAIFRGFEPELVWQEVDKG